MNRQPNPGSDKNTWGTVLNSYLSQLSPSDKGGINYWTNSTKPTGLTPDDEGRTGVNTETQSIERWSGSGWVTLLDGSSNNLGTTLLTGLNTGLTGTLTAADNVLDGFGKIWRALTWKMPRYAIVIGYDADCDIVYSASQDFSVKMLEAISLANSNTPYGAPKYIIIKKGIYYQDTPLDLPFDPTLTIEGKPRWETAYLGNGVSIQFRGNGYSGVAPYQIGMKGNTLIPTGTQTYNGSVTKGLRLKDIAFNGGNIANTTIKTTCNIYFFNQDRVEIEYCRFLNTCGNIIVDSDIEDSAFDASKQPGGIYINRCNFIAFGDGTATKYAWIKWIKNTQCWVNNCWFAQSTLLDYGIWYDRSDKIKTSNCEFNVVKTAMFRFDDSALVPCNNNTITGSAIIPEPADGYVVSTNLVHNASANLIGACHIVYNTHADIHEGSNVNGVVIAGCSGYARSSANNNYMLKYVHGYGDKISNVATTDVGSVGVGKNTNLSMLHVKVPANFNGNGTVSSTIGSPTLTGVGTLFTKELAKGDYVVVGSETRTISNITSDTTATITTNFTTANSGVSFTIKKSAFTMESSSGIVYSYISNDGLTGVGIASPGARYHIEGIADNIQLLVRGNDIQTKKIVSVQKSDNTELLTIDNAGNTAAFGTLAASNLSGTNTGDETAATIKTKLAFDYGELYQGPTTGLAALSTTAGVYVKTAGTTIAGINSTNFVADTTGRLTYNGATKIFDVSAVFGYGVSSSTPTYSFKIAKNGTVVDSTFFTAKSTTTNSTPGACSGIVSLSAGDYIELWVTNDGVTAPSVRMWSLNLKAKEIS